MHTENDIDEYVVAVVKDYLESYDLYWDRRAVLENPFKVDNSFNEIIGDVRFELLGNEIYFYFVNDGELKRVAWFFYFTSEEPDEKLITNSIREMIDFFEIIGVSVNKFPTKNFTTNGVV